MTSLVALLLLLLLMRLDSESGTSGQSRQSQSTLGREQGLSSTQDLPYHLDPLIQSLSGKSPTMRTPSDFNDLDLIGQNMALSKDGI